MVEVVLEAGGIKLLIEKEAHEFDAVRDNGRVYSEGGYEYSIPLSQSDIVSYTFLS